MGSSNRILVNIFLWWSNVGDNGCTRPIIIAYSTVVALLGLVSQNLILAYLASVGCWCLQSSCSTEACAITGPLVR